MFKHSLYLISAVVGVIFVAIFSKSWIDFERLHNTSKMLATDSIPGLIDAALAHERICENHDRLSSLLRPHTTDDVAEIRSYLRANATDPLWKDYAASIFTDEDRRNYAATMAVREKYLAVRGQFLELAAAGRSAESIALYNRELTPQFERYKAAVKTLLTYNASVAGHRERTIVSSATSAPLAIATLVAFTFVIGGVLGLRVGLGGGFFASRSTI